MPATKLSSEDRDQALQWYIRGFDLITIGQHFGLTYDQIANELRTV